MANLVQENEELVSIIIPFHNRLTLLDRAVDSVLKQTYQFWELFLVDDCSDEKYELKSTDERIKLIQNAHNLGPGGSRQVGLEQAEGDFYLFLDSDDYLAPSFLEVSLSVHSDYPHLAFTYCTSLFSSDNEKKESAVYRKSNIAFSTILPTLFSDHRPWPTCALVWRAPLYQKWRIDIKRWEDYLFEFEAGLNNNRIKHIPIPLCYVNESDSQSLSFKAESLSGLHDYFEVLAIMLNKLNSYPNLPRDLVSKLKFHIGFRLIKNCIKLYRDYPGNLDLIKAHLQQVRWIHWSLRVLVIGTLWTLNFGARTFSILLLKSMRKIAYKHSR